MLILSGCDEYPDVTYDLEHKEREESGLCQRGDGQVNQRKHLDLPENVSKVLRIAKVDIFSLPCMPAVAVMEPGRAIVIVENDVLRNAQSCHDYSIYGQRVGKERDDSRFFDMRITSSNELQVVQSAFKFFFEICYMVQLMNHLPADGNGGAAN